MARLFDHVLTNNQVAPPLHCKLKYNKPHFHYKVYQECVSSQCISAYATATPSPVLKQAMPVPAAQSSTRFGPHRIPSVHHDGAMRCSVLTACMVLCHHCSVLLGCMVLCAAQY
eukprot:3114713-Rhodomonas_salina.1